MKVERNRLNAEHRTTGAMEAFKTLRTNLLYIEDLQVIAVTSTTSDEGKTITTFNLAKSFAELGKRVLLIDCDLRRSSLHQYINVPNKGDGFSEALTNQSSNYVNSTTIENLYVILSGKKPPNPSELLSGKTFDVILEKLRDKFDYIIIDTPPAMAAMDATIISRKADGTILVTRNDYTKKKVLIRVKNELIRNGARIVGVVLNGVKKNQVDYKDYGYDKYY